MATMCGYDEERLTAFHDGAVGETDRRKAAEHLRDCAECRGRLEELRRIDAEVVDLPVPGWNEATARRFTAGVMARIAVPAAANRPGRRAQLSLGWLGATLSAAAALLVFVSGARFSDRPAVEAVPAMPAATAPDAFAYKAGFPASKMGKNGVGSDRDCFAQTVQIAQDVEVDLSQQGQVREFAGQNDIAGGMGSNDLGSCSPGRTVGVSLEAQITLNYRGFETINPAIAVDRDALAQRTLADSEAVMTFLLNSSQMDADGLAQLRESIVANGVDDRVRTALHLVEDREVARPLERMQVLLVHLANGAPASDPEEMTQLKQTIVSRGLIEEVRLSRVHAIAAK